MRLFAAFISALIFGLGLGVSGMTDPENVRGFLDIFGNWKPALMFVMGGAVLFHGFSYTLITKRRSPLLGGSFSIPQKKLVDARLIAGSALFGIGWGLGGYCPGPAISSLFTFDSSVFIFLISMIAGMFFFHYLFKPVSSKNFQAKAKK